MSEFFSEFLMLIFKYLQEKQELLWVGAEPVREAHYQV